MKSPAAAVHPHTLTMSFLPLTYTLTHSLHSAIPITQTGRKQMCHLLGPVSNLCWWWISPISPHAAPEFSETKGSYEIILSLEWLLWLDTGTGLAICSALRQRNDMIRTNYRVFLHANTLKGLVSKYDMLYSFWEAKKCPCVMEFIETLLVNMPVRDALI